MINSILFLNLSKEAQNQEQEETCMLYLLLLNLLMVREEILHLEFILKSKKLFKLMIMVLITVVTRRKLIFLNSMQEQLLDPLFTF